jgi:NADPH:quinone reductase-like Zn-dependent oxidoreductase
MSRVVRFHRFGGSDVLTTEDLDMSQPDAGEVLVSV